MKIPKYIYKKMIRCNKLCAEHTRLKQEIDEYFEGLGVLDEIDYNNLTKEEKIKYLEIFKCHFSNSPFLIDLGNYVDVLNYGGGNAKEIDELLKDINIEIGKGK